MTAMFGGGVGGNGTVVSLTENRADVGGRCGDGTEDIRVGWLFAKGFLAILWRGIDRAVAAVGCAIR